MSSTVDGMEALEHCADAVLLETRALDLLPSPVFDLPNSRVFYDKRISQEAPADSIGDEWKGYVFRITG